MLNGNGALDTSTHRLFDAVRGELSHRRLDTLVEAINEHRARAARFTGGPRPHDEALYRSLREIAARPQAAVRAE
jgi:hypothetical protein